MSLNVTIDDFDPLIAYGDYAAWSTPDPSQNPTFWNVSTEVSGVPWHQATYHLAKAGATAYLNFTGPSVWIYGSTGSSSNYTIGIDPDLPQPFSQDYTTSIPSDTRGLLYSSDQLTDSAHRLQITNNAGDDGLRLDLVVIGQQLGAEGATLTNTTVQDNSPDITYSGSWTEQSGPNFSGGTSHYTQGPGNAFEYSFTGSAIYIYGDQVNDHGPYSIYLNGSTTPYATYTGRSGCGSSTYEKTCEKLHGLIGFVGGLPEGRHTIKLENQGPAEGDRTYVDFDYLEYTTPSQYRMLNSVQSHQCPFVTCDSVAGPSGSGAAPSGTASAGTGVSGSSGSTPSPSGSGAAGAPSPTGAAAGGPDVGSGLLGLVLGLWVLKRVWQF